MITALTSPQYVNRIRQDWTANGGVYGDGGVYMATPANNPFAQLGPTLDLVFAGTATDPLDVASTTDDTLSLNFTAEAYQIAAQYAVWGTGGLQAVNFADIVTFTRASTATYFNSAGTLTTATTNEARLDYDPATLAARGFLIEEARTNNFTNSNDFSNAWGVVGTSLTVTANTTTSPDGTVNADSVVESAATEIHYALKDFSITGNATYSLSVFVKNLSGTRFLGLRISNTAWTNRITAVFDPSTGTWASAPSNTGTATGATGTIQNVGNGWYRVTITGLPDPAVATVRATIAISNSAASSLPSYAGDGTSGFYLWGAQLEAGAFPTSYIPTTTTALTRNADVASVNTLSPWYNAGEGTLFGESVSSVPGATLSGSIQPNIVYITDGTSNNRIGMFYNTGNVISGRIVTAGAATNPADRSANLPSVNRSALAYAVGTNQGALSVNGSAVTTSSPAGLPVVDRMSLGGGPVGISLNGHLRRITYYPRRLSNADLQTITT